MYFMVLGQQKVIIIRYILVNNFMFFRDPHFYWFLIDFGRPGASKNGALAPMARFQKKKMHKKRVSMAPRGPPGWGKNSGRCSKIASLELFYFNVDFPSVPGHHFGRFWMDLAWNVKIFNQILGINLGHRFARRPELACCFITRF